MFLLPPRRTPFAHIPAAAPLRASCALRADGSSLCHVTQVYGLAGVPLPFYNSTTLRLSPGLSPRVWATVRPFFTCCALIPRNC